MNSNISPISTCAECLEDFDTNELNAKMTCSECEPKEKITSLFFEGQQWTPRHDGGIYQAVRVWANGRLLGSTGYGYGGGTDFEYFALEFLHRHGLITDEMRKNPSWMLRNHGVTLYTSLSHVSKRELVKSQDILENIARFATI